MKPYPEYKSTGLAWLPQVPIGWKVETLRHMLVPFSEKGHPNETLLSVIRERGVIVRDKDNDDENHNFIPDDLSGYKFVKRGQFVMNKMKAWQGSYGISPCNGIVSPAYFVFDLRCHDVIQDFFHVAIRAKWYVPFFGRASDGIRVGQWDLSLSRMKEIPFMIPPPAEQRAIVSYLDRETAKIDRLIQLKERMVELLNEKKQTTISRVVTRGLDPNAELVDSGADWIGKVPKGWKVMRLKSIAEYIMDGDWINADIITGAGVRYLTSGNVGVGVFKSQGDGHVSYQTFTSLGFTKALPGDLLISRLNEPIGRSCIVPEGEPFYVVAVDNVIFRCKSFCVKEYFNYTMNCAGYAQSAFELASGATMKRISRSKLVRLNVPVPPLSEQREIVAYLDSATTMIDAAVKAIEKSIVLLKERRVRLVSDAVTGRIDVRKEVA